MRRIDVPAIITIDVPDDDRINDIDDFIDLTLRTLVSDGPVGVVDITRDEP